MAKFWSFTYKRISNLVENSPMQEVCALILENLEKRGELFRARCCAKYEKEPWFNTPESFVDFLNRSFPYDPKYVLVDKREISEEEYQAYKVDQQRRAARTQSILNEKNETFTRS